MGLVIFSNAEANQQMVKSEILSLKRVSESITRVSMFGNAVEGSSGDETCKPKLARAGERQQTSSQPHTVTLAR